MKLAVETKVKTSKIVVKLDILWVVSIKIKAFVVDKIYTLTNPATSLRKSGGAIAPPAPLVPTPMLLDHLICEHDTHFDADSSIVIMEFMLVLPSELIQRGSITVSD